jgi:hypothetical protein
LTSDDNKDREIKLGPVLGAIEPADEDEETADSRVIKIGPVIQIRAPGSTYQPSEPRKAQDREP